MIREALNNIDYSWLASTSLVLFFAVFATVTAKTMFTKKETIDYQADIPLSDGERSNP